MILYHSTTEKKAKLYRVSGSIHKPVRGFDSLTGAMYWSMKVGRKVIYKIDVPQENIYKLPDHHNEYGQAWWVDCDVPVNSIKCVVSPK